MPNPATTQERRLRKTKAQLIDEIDTLEQRAAAIEIAYRSGAPMRAKASDRYLANQELLHLAKFPSENPNPVLRVISVLMSIWFLLLGVPAGARAGPGIASRATRGHPVGDAPNARHQFVKLPASVLRGHEGPVARAQDGAGL